jgi:hypothetical protein
MTENKKLVGNEAGRKESIYPLYGLDEALKIAEAVRDMGGSRTSVSKAILAKHLKYAVTGPSFVQRIASAKTFGLVDGWGTYTLTDQAKRYFYPTTESDKTNASLSILSSPSSFRLLIDRFDGVKLPSNDMMGNILHQEANVPISWKDRIASMFVRSAQLLGIIDSDGFMRYGSAMREQSITTIAQVSSEPLFKPSSNHPLAQAPLPNKPMQGDDGNTVWVFRNKNGGQIRLETPEDMSKDLWDKLNAYVQILKPSQDGVI